MTPILFTIAVLLVGTLLMRRPKQPDFAIRDPAPMLFKTHEFSRPFTVTRAPSRLHCDLRSTNPDIVIDHTRDTDFNDCV